MITLHPISAGSGVDYLLGSVAHGDVDEHSNGQSLSGYLSEHGDAPGRWGGRGAVALGLAGEVTDEAADAIFKHGADPRTGELLGRAWPRYPTAQDRYERMIQAEPQASPQRRAELWAKASKAGNCSAKSGWEMVLSPVKSFSVAWGLADDAGRIRLEAAEERAFTAVFARLEAELAWTRIGTGGAAQIPADGLTGAVFVHRSSRAGDPTYHRHLALSARVPVRESVVDQRAGQTRQRTRWLSLDATPLHAMTVTLGEYYTAELERQMAALGYLAEPRTEVERVGKRPVREFAGVPDEVIAHFSARRTQTTKEYAKFLADFTARESRAPTRAEQYRLFQAAALKNRPDKKAHVSVAEERACWRTSAAAKGGISHPQRLGKQMAEASATLGVRVEEGWRAQLPARVLAALAGSRAIWRRSNVEAEVTRQLVAVGAHLAEPGPLTALIGQTVAAVLGDGGTVPLTPPEPVPSPAGYRRADGESVFRAVNSAVFTAQALLDAEARLTAAATGPAGVRTLSVTAVGQALAHGDAARGFAASAEQQGVARAVFGADRRVGAVVGPAGSGKTTVMRLVREVATAHGIPVLGLSTGQVQADHLAGEAGIRAENIARWLHMSEQVHPGDPDWTLALGTLVIVDEAGQAGTLDLDALLSQVEAAGGRLLLVGDPLQTGSVEAGGLLADLEAAGTVLATLGGVARFRDHDGVLREWGAC
jgi:conjugative relaxase-like TrwC/TraI family protein